MADGAGVVMPMLMARMMMMMSMMVMEVVSMLVTLLLLLLDMRMTSTGRLIAVGLNASFRFKFGNTAAMKRS